LFRGSFSQPGRGVKLPKNNLSRLTPNPGINFYCISMYFFKPNDTLFDLINFVYLIFKGAKKDFSSFKITNN